MIAAVRDPENASSRTLRALPKGDGSSLFIVKIDSASQVDPTIAIAHLRSAWNITCLDVVIANAGISKCLPRVADVTLEDLQEHISVNAMGPLLLFQAVLPLLEKSAEPKFVVISSSAGSLGGMETRAFPNAAYGTSKATLNYLTRKMHYEHENLVVFPVDPG